MQPGKRFYKEVRVNADEDGHRILLDDRPVKTPGRAPLALPGRAMAEAVAREWKLQGDRIDLDSMPLTRRASATLDYVFDYRGEVVEEIARYGETDLLCYRAESPPELRERQDAEWQPFLDWAKRALNVRLDVAPGLLPVAQDESQLSRLAGIISRYRPFVLTGLHDAVKETGSVILGLALAEGECDAEAAWRVSQIEEAYQNAQWGEDAEAVQRQEARKETLLIAVRFMRLAQEAGREGD